MKTLYVITGLGGGGAEKVVADLADQMVKLGHQVKIAYLKGEVVVRPKSKDIELIYLGLETPLDFYKAFKRYTTLLKYFSPNVVHAHMVHANIFTRICRKFYPVHKLISSAHSNNEGGRFRMLAYKYTHQMADITTNVSYNASQNFEQLGAVPKGGMITVHNGVDLGKFNPKSAKENLVENLGVDPSTPLFIAIGRFHDAKDYPNLIDAFFKFKQTPGFKTQKPKLLIAGDGELRSEIEFKIQELSLDQDILLLGRRDDIVDLLNTSDYFVLSSKYEGLPTVVIESMACQTYVIATDCGGSAEIMGDTGLLVEPQNSSALAEALEKALQLNVVEVSENNKKARHLVEEKFSLNASVNNWLEIYAS